MKIKTTLIKTTFAPPSYSTITRPEMKLRRLPISTTKKKAFKIYGRFQIKKETCLLSIQLSLFIKAQKAWRSRLHSLTTKEIRQKLKMDCSRSTTFWIQSTRNLNMQVVLCFLVWVWMSSLWLLQMILARDKEPLKLDDRIIWTGGILMLTEILSKMILMSTRRWEIYLRLCKWVLVRRSLLRGKLIELRWEIILKKNILKIIMIHLKFNSLSFNKELIQKREMILLVVWPINLVSQNKFRIKYNRVPEIIHLALIIGLVLMRWI